MTTHEVSGEGKEEREEGKGAASDLRVGIARVDRLSTFGCFTPFISSIKPTSTLPLSSCQRSLFPRSHLHLPPRLKY